MKLQRVPEERGNYSSKVCCVVLALTLLIGAEGCTTSSAAGCGVGVLAGMALAGLALAAAKNSDVNGGAVILGGGLFGVVSGCSAAAVADAMARSDEQKQARERRASWQPEGFGPPAYPPPRAAAPRAPTAPAPAAPPPGPPPEPSAQPAEAPAPSSTPTTP